jgi:XTP/dITP diphosphohydrolase
MPLLLLATSNPHKLEELRAILGPSPVGLDSLPTPIPEPDESADTFEENARLKAIAYARATGLTCLADDSGLEVDALHGSPGVHSAYYADWNPAHNVRLRISTTRAEQDERNNARLLRSMNNVPDEQRTARFVCAMCVAAPDGRILAESRGTFEGRIGHVVAGDNGFGYDPLLVLDDGRTSAELSTDEKNARSHRAAAAHAIAPQLRALGLLRE